MSNRPLISGKEWKSFSLNDERYFKLYTTLSSIDKNKLIKDNQLPQYPYVTRTELSNGIASFVGKQNYELNPENVISIGLDTQTVFYQPAKFYTGQNIQILEVVNLNRNIALFLITVIKKQLETLNWGGNGATLGRLRTKSILLPVDSNDEPDWSFMEEYILNLEKKQFEKLQLPKHEELTTDYNLEDISWGEFAIEDIFEISSGVRLVTRDQKNGDTPFIGASMYRNGVTNFVSNVNKSLDKNVLGVIYNGNGMVLNFYHQYEAIFSDDVKRWKFKDIVGDKYHYLFVQKLIIKQKSKFMYGYKFNSTRMNRQKIMLPINENGEPNYDFMSGYMKKIEQKVLKKFKK